MATSIWPNCRLLKIIRRSSTVTNSGCKCSTTRRFAISLSARIGTRNWRVASCSKNALAADALPCFTKTSEASWRKSRRPKANLKVPPKKKQRKHIDAATADTSLRTGLLAGGQRVRFCCVTELITQLMEAREERTLSRMKSSLANFDVLILDELSYVPASKLGAELLCEVISSASERQSLIVTTNLPFRAMDRSTWQRAAHRCRARTADASRSHFRFDR